MLNTVAIKHKTVNKRKFVFLINILNSQMSSKSGFGGQVQTFDPPFHIDSMSEEGPAPEAFVRQSGTTAEIPMHPDGILRRGSRIATTLRDPGTPQAISLSPNTGIWIIVILLVLSFLFRR